MNILPPPPKGGFIVAGWYTLLEWLYKLWKAFNDSYVDSYRSNGLQGAVNGATPLTKYDLSADSLVLIDQYKRPIVRTAVAPITCDLGLAGPVANGRDQSGAFSVNSWVHLYFIWDGLTVATVASLTAPPTGPTLPSGFTHWCYATALRWNASSNIVPMLTKGSYCFWNLTDTSNRILASGAATTMTAVSAASFVPPNALYGVFSFILSLTLTTPGNIQLLIRPTGSAIGGQQIVSAYVAVASQTGQGWNSIIYPLGTSSQIDYKLSAAPTSDGAFIDVMGFFIPNGG